MKRYLSLLSLIFLTNIVLAQTKNPKEIVEPSSDPTVKLSDESIASCQKATQELGNNVLKGNYLYTKEKMYPRYMKRQITLHGQAKFDKQFEDISDTLIDMGVTINSFSAEAPVGFFRVWPELKPDAKMKLDSGEQKDVADEDVIYSLLVMVPTTQVWTFTSSNGKPPRKLKRIGFQIAIAKEVEIPGTEEWTFIDGGTIQPNDLRAMFSSLPLGLVLPERADSEILK